MLTGLMPIGDDNQDRHITPYVTYMLIAINVAVFVFLQVPNDAFTYGYSVIPQEITRGIDLTTPQGIQHNIPQAPGPSPIYLTIFSAMFMHGGFMHLASNMLYLWIFGDNVEDALGHAKFLIFYAVCGVAATFAQIVTAPYSVIPTLGASGAIAGVLGGYLLMFPARSVRVLIGYMGIVAMPAIIVIGLWIALQFMNGFGSIAITRQTAEQGGVAYFAHIGGAVAGLLLVSLFRNDASRRRAQQRISYPAGRSDYDNRWRS
ncbi:MAG TPA: rhomboid family intramembrane serine protease [Abditibacteriaceae bacterium]|nr:rhomboid family intramembrane serine protease [Abditibacteriaceae bacterium]